MVVQTLYHTTKVNCNGAEHIKKLWKNDAANILQHQHLQAGWWLVIGLEWEETETELFHDGGQINPNKNGPFGTPM